MKPYLQSLHTTIPGVVLILFAGYELVQKGEITANGMVLLTTGYGLLKAKQVEKV